MGAPRLAFIVMPFGGKTGPDGVLIDFDAVYQQLLAPAVEAAGLEPYRADADRRSGSIHVDMFQQLLLAEYVIADLTIDNPNVWYELGVRHALRASGSVLVHARERLPFDIANQRTLRYALRDGRPDAAQLDRNRDALTQVINADLAAWRGRRSSPVYQTLPSLIEPDWKSLRVGEINEQWERLSAWERLLDVAKKKLRPGDILVLAEETPSRALEFEALAAAASALLQLNRPRFALEVAKRALELDPTDLRMRRIEAIAYGRQNRAAEAYPRLQALVADRRDGETLGLLASARKEDWVQAWRDYTRRRNDPVAAAKATSAALLTTVTAYLEAACAEPSNTYPAINAIALGHLYREVVGRSSKLDALEQLTAATGWLVECASQQRDYWTLATRAEYALVKNDAAGAAECFADALDCAIETADLFALDSTRKQLEILRSLGFRAEIAASALERIADAIARLGEQRPPGKVVLFSGHMIDDPRERGPGLAHPARFPDDKRAAAAQRIDSELDRLGLGADDLGICGGACGGDLLFADAALRRGMRLELYLAEIEPDFLNRSVTFADPHHYWEQLFMKVKHDARTKTLVMPDALGPKQEQDSVHDRCNRWMLYTALASEWSKLELLALWDGAPGVARGGTGQMVQLIGQKTGRRPLIIDPKTL